MRGRPPKPKALHVAQGTYQPSRHGGSEPSSGDGALLRPAKCRLTGDAKKFWDSEIPKLQKLGVIDAADSAAVFMMCRWWAIWRAADKELEQIQSGKKKGNAYTAMIRARMAQNSWQALAIQFGLTPVARAKLRAEPPGPADELQEYLDHRPA